MQKGRPGLTDSGSSTTVLVTGGAGFIGAHACKALAVAGYTPVAYDNLVHGQERAVKWGPFEQGDILDGKRLQSVIARHEPAAVMHFAAFAYVGESVTEPGKYYRNNAAGSLTLLEAARDAAIPHIVFSSTCATYGMPERVPIAEDTPQRPINPYGRSKLMVEEMLRDFSAAHPLRWTALRYFNAAGADPDGEIGEDHDPETHLIPLALRAAAGTAGPLTIFGNDYETPDGTCVRDFIHVTDLADAHVRALQALECGAPSAAYNLGNGNGFSVREVVRTVEEVTGRSVPATIGPRREGDPPVLVADASSARAALGWKPELPELSEIVRTAWAWGEEAWG